MLEYRTFFNGIDILRLPFRVDPTRVCEHKNSFIGSSLGRMAGIGRRLTVNTLRTPSWKPSGRQQINHGTRRAPCEKPICASTLLPLKATMRRTEAHGSIPTASTRTFTSLLGTSTRTDILTTATPGSGVSLSWWKGIFRQSEEHWLVETQANRRSVRHC